MDSLFEASFMNHKKRLVSPPSPPRRDRERTRHRREILDAAERVFAVRGYHATTMELIARESEFSVGSLYNFFPSKNALYDEIINGIAERFLSEMDRRVLRLASPAEALHALVDLRLDSVEQHRGFVRMALEEFAVARLHPSGALPKQAQSAVDQYLKGLIVLFQRGIRSGVFDPEPAIYQAVAFDGMVNALTFYWATHKGTDLSREEGRAAIVNRFLAHQGRAPAERRKGER